MHRFNREGCYMVARGHVQNGVVVLDDGVRLPEGQEVTVLGTAMASAAPQNAVRPHSVLDIPPASLGAVLSVPGADDLLGEMLEDRR
jgi:hypothetical protein